MCKDRILGYAVDFGVREIKRRRMNYKDSWPVAPVEISNFGTELIHRLVCDGIRAAIAREQKDEATAALHRETVSKCRGLIKSEFKGTVSSYDLFECGYRCVRNDS
jgi:hypothetical protein